MRITPISQQLANLQNPILPSALAADRAVRQEMVKDNASQLRQARSNVESVLRREVGYNPMPGVASNVTDLQSTQTQLSNMRMQRMASSGGDVAMAIPRFYDPMEQWDLSGYPWNMADEGHRHKLHKWLRLYYSTHRLLPQLVDIYTRFPLAGTSLYSKDLQLTKFYEDLFLGELEYEDFLVSLGREFWLIGEAFPLGRFNEDLGIWEDEELLDPENMVIENIPILGGVQFKVNPPDYLKKIVREKSPAKFYKLLEQTYPELVPYLRRDEAFPVSDVLLKHVAFKVTPFDAHGTPLLLRGLRTLMHEEKLLSAMDATAERGYAPFLLAKLGIQDMGPNSMPWIPGADEIAALRDDIDVALSQDFRLLVHHYGLDIENIFGREDMPDFGNDFDRIDRWLMQIFGITPSLLGGAGADAPYATSALNAEQLNQMLRTYQKFLKNHYDSRAAVVAEAQGHYDYEKRGQTRVPIMEKVIVTDPETNKQYIETRHKLMYPKMEFSTLDVRDEATERQFLQTLRAMGVPISDEKLMVAVNFEFKDSLDEMQEEMLQKTIAQQMAKMLTYKICQAKGLPIPMDLKAEVEGQVMGGQPPPGGGGGPPPGGGGPPPGGGGGGGMVMPPPPEDLMGGGLGPGGQGGATPGGGPPPAGPLNSQRGTVPEASNERRPGMPQFSHTAMVEDDEGNISYDVWKLSVEEVERAYREAKALNLEFEVAKRERRIAAESGRTIIPEDYDRENPDYTLCEECGRDHSQEKISSKIPHKKLREFERDE